LYPELHLVAGIVLGQNVLFRDLFLLGLTTFLSNLRHGTLLIHNPFPAAHGLGRRKCGVDQQGHQEKLVDAHAVTSQEGEG
jgi:hypothetical protein